MDQNNNPKPSGSDLKPRMKNFNFFRGILGVGPTLDARSLFLGGGHTQGYLGCAQVWENDQLTTIFLLNDKQMSNKVRVEHQPIFFFEYYITGYISYTVLNNYLYYIFSVV